MSMKLPFFRSKKNDVEPLSHLDNIPDHVAIIMDGNGRWAHERGLPRVAGHKEGMDTVRDIVKSAKNNNVKILTLYTFSTENWKRPKSEVDFIMRLPKEFIHLYLPEMVDNNIRIQTIGDFDELPEHTKKAVRHAKEKTAENDGLILNFALNYGGRVEIVRAIKRIMGDIERQQLSLDALDETTFSNYLYTQGLTDPDLLIRTSGEQRISNFLLWQLAYTEFWFTEVLWPDFHPDVFQEALQEYQQRKRRYGGI